MGDTGNYDAALAAIGTLIFSRKRADGTTWADDFATMHTCIQVGATCRGGRAAPHNDTEAARACDRASMRPVSGRVRRESDRPPRALHWHRPYGKP